MFGSFENSDRCTIFHWLSDVVDIDAVGRDSGSVNIIFFNVCSCESYAGSVGKGVPHVFCKPVDVSFIGRYRRAGHRDHCGQLLDNFCLCVAGFLFDSTGLFKNNGMPDQIQKGLFVQHSVNESNELWSAEYSWATTDSATVTGSPAGSWNNAASAAQLGYLYLFYPYYECLDIGFRPFGTP